MWARALEKYYDAPLKLAWFMEHRYSHSNMSLAALKGRDAHLVRRLLRLARDLRLELGLASFSVEVKSPYPSEDEERPWGLPDEKTSEAGSVHGLKLGDQFWPTHREVEHLVDMDGNLVCEEPDFSKDLSEEFMPRGWDGYSLQDWVPDSQEYEGYVGNEAGQITHCKCCVFDRAEEGTYLSASLSKDCPGYMTSRDEPLI